jgi:hypothetical protein
MKKAILVLPLQETINFTGMISANLVVHIFGIFRFDDFLSVLWTFDDFYLRTTPFIPK